MMAPIKSNRIHVHIKNNRDGDLVFRTTHDRYAQAAERHPEVAARLDTCIDWDLEQFDDSMRKAVALMTWDLPTEDLSERAPNLRWIHIIGAGVEHLAPFDWLPPGVTLTNNAGIHTEKTMEYVSMALLMLNNNIPKFAADQRRGRWDPRFSTPVAGKTAAVIGVGKMGGAAARSAKSLGLRVLGIRRHKRPARYVDKMYGPENLDFVLGEADFVILNTPLTPETQGMIGRRQLDLMKSDAGLINLARAQVVDCVALRERLEEGTLAGAILDVHHPEPLPPDAPLWDVPNLIITPHVSSDDDASYLPLTLDLFFGNMERLLAGKPLNNRVRPRLGY